LIDILVLLFLIALNGLFSMSELAIVSARGVRLRALSDRGTWGAKSALALAAEPGRFLSTVQIGITLVGIIAGAFSGATLGDRLGGWLMTMGASEFVAETLGFGIVISIVTFLSIVFGELVPKQLALVSPEAIACRVAPLMTLVSRLAMPAAWLLQASTHAVFTLFNLRKKNDAVSEEEIKDMISEAEISGVLESSEKHMISGVLRLGDRGVVGVMTPRIDVQWIDLRMNDAELRLALMETSHSRLPVGDGSIDAIMGVVQVRDLLSDVLAGRALDLRARCQDAPIIPVTTDALGVMEKLRHAPVPVALVHDEYGSFEGLVTPADLLEAIAGTFRSHNDEGEDPKAVQRADGSWLLAGYLPADEMADLLNMRLPKPRSYQTLAGYMLEQMGRIPATGEVHEADGWHFEVVDLDGNRIDKVIATPMRRRD
jgi:putative hemolysin